MTDTKRIEIDINETGLGSVVVDGVDMADILEGVDITIRAGSVTECHIRVSPHAIAMKGYASVQAYVDEFNESEQDKGEGGIDSLQA